MPEASAFLLFMAASLALLIVPGPAIMYIVARSIDQGRLAGVVSALGLAAGSVILVIAAAFGVSALLAASPAAFDVIRYLGTAYLLFLGIRTAIARPAVASEAHHRPWSHRGPSPHRCALSPHTARCRGYHLYCAVSIGLAGSPNKVVDGRGRYWRICRPQSAPPSVGALGPVLWVERSDWLAAVH